MYGEVANSAGERRKVYNNLYHEYEHLSPGERMVRDELFRQMLIDAYKKPPTPEEVEQKIANSEKRTMKQVRYFTYQSKPFIQRTAEDTMESTLAANRFVEVNKEHRDVKLIFWERGAPDYPYYTDKADVKIIRWRAKVETEIEEVN